MTMNAGEGASSSSTPSDSNRSLSENDQTSGETVVEDVPTAPLQRRLKSRHLQMIAIGGTVGTGLVRKPLTTGRLTNIHAPSVFAATTWNALA
jgi:amino acid permease